MAQQDINKWPHILIIDGILWEVKATDLSESLNGECDGNQCLIKVASRLNDQMKEQTFWHELIHAIWATRGWSEHKFDPTNIEEEIASLLGPALYSVFSVNANITWKPVTE